MIYARRILIPFVLILLLATTPVAALEHLVLRRDGQTIHLDGRTMIEARNGDVMFQTRDGTAWICKAEEIQGRSADDDPFVPYTSKELATRLLAQLPPGFDVHHTSNYVICHSTSRGYAQWCGALLERLHMAFTNYWRRKGFDLKKPEFPLAAIVFADKRSYVRYAQPEVGNGVEGVIAYYSLRTNRITMYDLTGMEASGGTGRGNTMAQINRILSHPDAAPTVATIVHEATHQIAFNCGLHQRYSDCPKWFSEGIATFFETPDLSSSRGWRSIGQINQLRLRHFRDFARHRPANSLATLLETDDRFHDTATSTDAYAEAWALTYFLIQQRPKEYVRYLQTLSEKAPQYWDTPEGRREDFTEVFGQDLDQLNQEMLRFMSRLR